MRLSYFQSRHGNIGDDLNPVLWPKVFGAGFFEPEDAAPDSAGPASGDPDSQRLFLGIGSIFDNRPEIVNPAAPTVVFGAGLRSARRAPANPGLFDIRFVRGPLSAHVLRKTGAMSISDPAILAPLYLPARSGEGSSRLGYVPYFMAPERLSQEIADAIGARLISPTLPPQDFIDAIASCDLIVSEALHGAILADAYRIPWAGVRLMSGAIEGRISLFKWADWMESLAIPGHLHAPIPDPVLYAPRRIRKSFDDRIRQRAVWTVQKTVQEDRWFLSSPAALGTAQSRIQDEVGRLKTAYPAGRRAEKRNAVANKSGGRSGRMLQYYLGS